MSIFPAVVAIFVAAPVIVVLASLVEPSGEAWAHLMATVLPRYVIETVLLSAGVLAFTFLVGTATAWLVTMARFPGRRFFEWALVIPLAVPAYILAYSYTGLLEFSGPVQSTLREMTGWRAGEYWFPDIRSLWGAVLMLGLALYPYVYLAARAAFLEQSACLLEVSRTLGHAPWRSFLRVALPIARPALVVGLSLVLMETLGDYGTVDFFAVDTFVTGIFRTWFGLGELVTAMQLAAWLALVIFAVLAVERWARRRAGYHHTTNRYRPLPNYDLKGLEAWAAFACCALPLLFGFGVPAAQLAVWAAGDAAAGGIDARFIEIAGNSLKVAAIAAFVTIVIALLLAYAARHRGGALMRGLMMIASLGYAVPGAVIAVGLVILLGWVDQTLIGSLILSGGIFALIYAYAARFLALGLGTLDAGLATITPSMDWAARTLGATPARLFARLHVPLMLPAVLTALLVVFVDVMKELPATLILRPFDFNTLAVRAYELASDERLSETALPALTIVAVGLGPVVVLGRAIAKARAGTAA